MRLLGHTTIFLLAVVFTYSAQASEAQDTIILTGTFDVTSNRTLVVQPPDVDPNGTYRYLCHITLCDVDMLTVLVQLYQYRKMVTRSTFPRQRVSIQRQEVRSRSTLISNHRGRVCHQRPTQAPKWLADWTSHAIRCPARHHCHSDR